ncbi:MAG: ABC transporter transmembrane domain-containing protein, partial [Candidatus Hodarchaeota archaeon]
MRIPFYNYWRLQKAYLTPYKTKIVLLSIALISDILFQLLIPQVIGYFMDSFRNNVSSNVLLMETTLLFIVLSLIQLFFHIFTVYLSQDLVWASTNNLRTNLMQHCLNLDMSFHNRHKPGEMIERIDGDVNVLANFFSQFTVTVLLNILLILGILTVFYITNFLLGVVFTLFILVALTVMYYVRKLGIPYWKAVRQVSADLFGFIEESLSSTENIRPLGATNFILRKFHQLSKEEYEKTMKASKISIKTLMISDWGVEGAIFTLVFFMGVFLYNEGIISSTTILVIYLYVVMLVNPIQRVFRQIQSLQQVDAIIDRVNELFQMETNIITLGNMNLASEPLHVEFN